MYLSFLPISLLPTHLLMGIIFNKRKLPPLNFLTLSHPNQMSADPLLKCKHLVGIAKVGKD